MWTVINKLIDQGFGDINWNKALDAISHLKQRSIKEEEYKIFNDGLTKFKMKYMTKKKALWRKVKDRKISLICIDDFTSNGDDGMIVEGLTVTKSESDAFLMDQVSVKPEVKTVDVDSDDDMDLLI